MTGKRQREAPPRGRPFALLPGTENHAIRAAACAMGVLFAAGCGSAPRTETARPAEPPPAPLQTVEEDAPFIVDWDARQIASLTAALRTPNAGGVVVAYPRDVGAASPGGGRNVIRVLPDCHLSGAYVPSGIGMYRGMLQVRRFDSPARGPATRKDALQQIATSTNVPPGAPLDYRFVLVGRHYLSGHRPNATIKDLTSKSADGCRDATHFVRAALHGAFEHTTAPTPGGPPPGEATLVQHAGDFTPCVMAGNATSPACAAFLKIELTALLPAPVASAAAPTIAPTPSGTAPAASSGSAPQIAIPSGPATATLPAPSVTAAPTTAPQIAIPKPGATPPATAQPTAPPPATSPATAPQIAIPKPPATSPPAPAPPAQQPTSTPGTPPAPPPGGP